MESTTTTTTTSSILEDAQRLKELAKEFDTLSRKFKERIETEHFDLETMIKTYEVLWDLPGSGDLTFYADEAVKTLYKKIPDWVGRALITRLYGH